MTKEVAEKIVNGIIDKIECNVVDIDDWAEFWGFTREEYEEFLDMAIKTPQEPIFDKIRTEIETKYGQCKLCEFVSDYDGVYTDIGDISDVLQIIDKYKKVN